MDPLSQWQGTPSDLTSSQPLLWTAEKSHNFHQQIHLDILNHYFTTASITVPFNTIVYIHMFGHASYKWQKPKSYNTPVDKCQKLFLNWKLTDHTRKKKIAVTELTLSCQNYMPGALWRKSEVKRAPPLHIFLAMTSIGIVNCTLYINCGQHSPLKGLSDTKIHLVWFS